MANIYEVIDKNIQEILSESITNKKKQMSTKRVLSILLEIESLLPELVIDGDELVKYFKRKKPRR